MTTMRGRETELKDLNARGCAGQGTSSEPLAGESSSAGAADVGGTAAADVAADVGEGAARTAATTAASTAATAAADSAALGSTEAALGVMDFIPGLDVISGLAQLGPCDHYGLGP